MNNLNEERRKRVAAASTWRIVVLCCMVFAIMATPAFAATNYVQSGATWLLGMVKWLCLIGTIGMGVFCVIKKEFSKMAIFLIIGAFLTYICAKPNVLVNLGTAIGTTFKLN